MNPGHEDLLYGEVIFPLRYDIMSQAEAYKPLYDAADGDLDKMVELCQDGIFPRHIRLMDNMFQELGVKRTLEGALQDKRVTRYIKGNFKKLNAIYESFRAHGWLSNEDRIFFNIPLNTPLTTEGHQAPPDGMFLANGQHRCISWWAHTGKPVFIQKMWGTRQRHAFAIVETTQRYINAGLLSPEEYVRFARTRYPDIDRRIKTVDGLRKWACDHVYPAWFHWYLDYYFGSE